MKVNLMCKECGYVPIVNPYYNQIFKYLNEKCKCKQQHQLVEIDEDILLAMSILVNKGYKTNFSCAGHITEGYNAAYVYFKERIPNELLPKSTWFEIENSVNGTTTIRGLDRIYDKQEDYTPTINDMVILQEDINMFRLELLKWALSLPNKK